MYSKLKVCKFLFHTFNTIFAVCNFALLIQSALTLYEISPYYSIDHVMEEAPIISFPAILWTIIAFAAFAFLLSFIGCRGAKKLPDKKNNQILIFFYLCALGVIIIVTAIVIAIGYFDKDQILQQAKGTLDSTFSHYGNDTDITQYWDTLQKNLECCGKKEYDDWAEQFVNDGLPASCCKETVAICTTQKLNRTEGCVTALTNILQRDGHFIYIPTAFLCGFEIIGVLLSLWLLKLFHVTYSAVHRNN